MIEFTGMPGHLIRRLNQASVSVFTERMAQAGLDLTQVQFAALNAIEAQPGLDQAGLAETIAYDRVTIGGVVDRLERKGFISRKVKENDRRARRLDITEAGQAVLQEVLPIVRNLQPAILEGLTEQERNTLVALIHKCRRVAE